MAIRFAETRAAETMKPAKATKPKRVLTMKQGRPPTGNAKVLVSIRLRPAILAHYKATGEGWQKRLDDDLARLIGV